MRLTTTLILATAATLTTAATDPVPQAIREKHMRLALSAVKIGGGSTCPFAAYGAVVVNHTSGGGEGEVVCTGYNSVKRDGNPTLHGEIAAINNCSAILTSPTGPYKLSGPQALDALKQLSIYTTGEACPMCASVIAQANFAEYIFASSAPDLKGWGWPQIGIRSLEVFEKSDAVQPDRKTRIVQGVLHEQTDDVFQWQFQSGESCPKGCARDDAGTCAAVTGEEHDEL